ncbi:hypothetical protein DRO35_02080 [Candidatus Bathyarchaeota archaeon]|nr:MAG: hypothetical protein DRO35_02080 [Candidatus Bathyarchaeota archaeon]
MNDLPTKKDIINSLIGGALCFLSAIFLSSFVDILLGQILQYFGISGVIIFRSFYIAKAIIFFALVHLICGFIGGVYTGYTVKSRIKIAYFITGQLGFIGFLVFTTFLSKVDFMSYYFEVIVLPLLGNLLGAYLGGYTIHWKSKEE